MLWSPRLLLVAYWTIRNVEGECYGLAVTKWFFEDHLRQNHAGVCITYLLESIFEKTAPEYSYKRPQVFQDHLKQDIRQSGE